MKSIRKGEEYKCEEKQRSGERKIKQEKMRGES
jgi:hypothetical protein